MSNEQSQEQQDIPMDETAKELLNKYPHVTGTKEGDESRLTIKRKDLFALMEDYAGYWKIRCEAAESVLSCIPTDDTFNNQYLFGFESTLKLWELIKNNKSQSPKEEKES